jgi:hypothetical protein
MEKAIVPLVSLTVSGARRPLSLDTIIVRLSSVLKLTRPCSSIRVCEFQLNFSDGTIGKGSFSIDETDPTSTFSNPWPDAFKVKEWRNNFLSFSFTKAGVTYDKASLTSSSFATYTYPVDSALHPIYGDYRHSFSFKLPDLEIEVEHYALHNVLFGSFSGSESSSGADIVSGAFR